MVFPLLSRFGEKKLEENINCCAAMDNNLSILSDPKM
jgi:hypothetical protein